MLDTKLIARRKPAILAALRKSKSLQDANTNLRALGADDFPQAIRWGLWDGYSGREPSTAGLFTGDACPEERQNDYLRAYAVGRSLSNEPTRA